jgi:hypothetical protein
VPGNQGGDGAVVGFQANGGFERLNRVLSDRTAIRIAGGTVPKLRRLVVLSAPLLTRFGILLLPFVATESRGAFSLQNRATMSAGLCRL